MPGAVTSGEMSETAATTITANEAAPKHSRLAWLDALRGFAALCVVFDHGSTLMLLPVRDFLYRWLDLGEYGVFVFFLVSGYIIPASLERKGSVRGFWTSRLFRLYPMYVVALVLAAVAYQTGYGTIRGAEHHPGQSVSAWLLMLPNLLTGPNVPNVTWTLSYEMVFYLLLVGAVQLGRAPAQRLVRVGLRGGRGRARRRAADGGAHALGGARRPRRAVAQPDRRRAGPRRHRRRALVAVPGGPGRGVAWPGSPRSSWSWSTRGRPHPGRGA